MKNINGRATLRAAMARKGVKSGQLASELGENRQTFANWIQYNKMGLNKFATAVDALGYDIVLVDKETGEKLSLIYDQLATKTS